MMATQYVATPDCMFCGGPGVLEVSASTYLAVRAYELGQGPRLIQDALPMLTAAEREQIKTGTHPECWDEMFPEEDE